MPTPDTLYSALNRVRDLEAAIRALENPLPWDPMTRRLKTRTLYTLKRRLDLARVELKALQCDKEETAQ